MAKAKRPTFIDLACQVGVVPDTPAGRAAYRRWIQRDPVAARQAAIDGISKSRVQSSSGGGTPTAGRSTPARMSKASREDQAAYPTAWRDGVEAHQRTSGIQTANGSRVRAASMTQDPATPYPATMLGGHATRARVVEARGGRPVQRSVHAAGDTPAYISAVREQEQAALAASQARRAAPTDPHEAIARAGDNAARLEDMRRAELERMQREVWSRA